MIPKKRKKSKKKKKFYSDEILRLSEHDFQPYRYARSKRAEFQKCGPIGPRQLTCK